MPFFELINVHSDYQYSTAKLFKSYVDEAGRYVVLIPERSDSLVRQPPLDSVRETAQKLNCSSFILGEMNRIGETVILNMAMYSTSTGEPIWVDRLKASGPDDLDPIFQKLAKALGSKNKAAENGDIYSVTNFEGKDLRQIQVKNSFGVALGGVFFTPGLLYGKSWEDPFVAGGAIFWAYDSRTLLFQLEGELYGAENNHMTAASISAFKPFSSENTTVFGGGGLGIARVDTRYQNKKTDGSGLTLQGGGGIIFNRLSTVQLRLTGKYFVGLFDLKSPRDEFPRGIIVRMEIAFGK